MQPWLYTGRVPPANYSLVLARLAYDRYYRIGQIRTEMTESSADINLELRGLYYQIKVCQNELSRLSAFN